MTPLGIAAGWLIASLAARSSAGGTDSSAAASDGSAADGPVRNTARQQRWCVCARV